MAGMDGRAPRKRSRRSAHAAGAQFEKVVADYLAQHVDDRVEPRRKNGVRDRGDLTGLKHLGGRLVVQCKNRASWNPGSWLGDTEVQRGNDDARVGLVVAKRHGKGDPGDQVVLMTLRDFAALLSGTRPDEEETT